ncbi:vitronectin [Ambystoma mexicanum]|uniref:vitronectin n=1 Tax=Ambystoma mexicanum TaxID=8296 RepID=UPI0037E78031
MKALLLLATALAALCSSLADEELCVGRCEEGFISTRKCQCDPLCVYYQSCCSDYVKECKHKVTRGDVFALPDDDEYPDYFDGNSTGVPLLATEPLATEPTVTESLEPETWETYPLETEPAGTGVPVQQGVGPLTTSRPPTSTSVVTSIPPPTDAKESSGAEEEEDVCSGKSFDAFTDLKNGSIYAFRGKYFYELDEKKAREGYPKLIEDVWGIQGPIDAAFTRINCQGKTYIFKGNKYWRFDNAVLDPGFPRNISSGFGKIPSDIDAAFAIPAKDYRSSERVYFFKGALFWEYEFKKQPSLQDCQDSPPSMAFTQYALMQTDDDWIKAFDRIFGSKKLSGASKPQYISRAWRGLPRNVDAAVAGRLYLPQPSKTQTRRNRRRKSRRNRRKYQLRQRKSWFSLFDWMSEEDDDDSDIDPDWLMPISQPCRPIQSVYFFKDDKYYRVNLETRRVDYVYPRYPRPIAQYWLGCRDQNKLK